MRKIIFNNPLPQGEGGPKGRVRGSSSPPHPSLRSALSLWERLGLGFLLFAFPLFAQVPPSTFDWLKTNLGGAACVVFQMGPSRAGLQPVTENTEVRFTDCDMTLYTATTVGPKSELRTFHVALGKLTPTSLTLLKGLKIPTGWVTAGEVPSATMRIAAPAGNPFEAKLEQIGANAPQASDYKTVEINILLLHKDTADKLVIELSRAIEICRKK